MKNCDKLGENWYQVYSMSLIMSSLSDSRYINRICEILVKLEKIITSGISGSPDTVLIDNKMIIK